MILLSTALPTTRGRRFSFPSRAPDKQFANPCGVYANTFSKLDVASTHWSRIGMQLFGIVQSIIDNPFQEPPPASGKRSSKTSPESEAHSWNLKMMAIFSFHVKLQGCMLVSEEQSCSLFRFQSLFLSIHII